MWRLNMIDNMRWYGYIYIWLADDYAVFCLLMCNHIYIYYMNYIVLDYLYIYILFTFNAVLWRCMMMSVSSPVNVELSGAPRHYPILCCLGHGAAKSLHVDTVCCFCFSCCCFCGGFCCPWRQLSQIEQLHCCVLMLLLDSWLPWSPSQLQPSLAIAHREGYHMVSPLPVQCDTVIDHCVTAQDICSLVAFLEF